MQRFCCHALIVDIAEETSITLLQAAHPVVVEKVVHRGGRIRGFCRQLLELIGLFGLS